MEKCLDLNYGNPRKFSVIEFQVAASGKRTLTSRFTGRTRGWDLFLLNGSLNRTLVYGHRASTPRCPQRQVY